MLVSFSTNPETISSFHIKKIAGLRLAVIATCLAQWDPIYCIRCIIFVVLCFTNFECIVFYALYYLCFILCIAFYTLCSKHCNLYAWNCTHSISCIVLYIYCIICLLIYALYSMHCILCIVFYTLYNISTENISNQEKSE